jgi:3'-phosphoadenosine 5'-phosphosulfate sulfotransferase (PAPS reductase)/FAD synthetase
MSDVLGRKQRIKNEDWLNAVKNIESTVQKSEIDSLIEKTVAEIKEKTAGKKAAFAWSGGKDSLVLERICNMSGIKACVLVICNLEYKAFVEWVEEHKPPELSIINTGQDIKWLAAHPHMLFPQDSNKAAQWFHIVQHRGQAKYYKENNLDVMLLGRRKADGNYVGRGDNIYTNGQGVTRYSPLSDWSHEQILAFIHYYNVEMPPIYEWQNGYYCGTHPWPARQWTGSIENGWKEVYEIDQSIVTEAAEFIPSAKAFLETVSMDEK